MEWGATRAETASNRRTTMEPTTHRTAGADRPSPDSPPSRDGDRPGRTVGRYLSGRSLRPGVSRLAVALVVLAVVLAGCGGFAGGDEPPDREPYGVDEGINPSGEDESEVLLTGLTTEGVTNASELGEAHREAIGNRSYTIETEYEYVIAEGDETFRQTSNSTISIDPDAETVRLRGRYRSEGNVSDVPTADEPNKTGDQWLGDRGVTRIEYENGSVEYAPPQGAATTGSERIDTADRSLLSPLEGSVVPTTAGAVDAEDGTYYVVNGSETVSGDEAEYGQESREVDVRALVREDGLIRQTVAEQEMIMEDGERIRIARTTEVTAVGETDVERPDWYEEAIAALPEPMENESGEGGMAVDRGAGAGNGTADERATTEANDSDDSDDVETEDDGEDADDPNGTTG